MSHILHGPISVYLTTVASLFRYKSDTLTEADIMLVVNSIADNNSFITLDRLPVDKVINLLTTHFAPNKVSPLAQSNLQYMYILHRAHNYITLHYIHAWICPSAL